MTTAVRTKKKRGPGRPPMTDRAKLRGRFVGLRLDAAELAKVERLATKWSVTMSEVLRRCLTAQK